MNRILLPLLTLVLSVVQLSCWAAEPKADQAKAIAEIEKLGGKVALDENTGDTNSGEARHNLSPQERHAKTRLAANGIYVQWSSAPSVSSSGSSVKEPESGRALRWQWDRPRRALPTAGFIAFAGRNDGLSFGAAAASELTNLRPVKNLGLFGCRVTNESLAVVSTHPSLLELNLCRSNLTDRGLTELSRLVPLRRLLIDDTEVTGLGIQSLHTLPNLEFIDATDNHELTEAVLIEGFPSLQRIELKGCPLKRVCIRGLTHLRGLAVSPVAETKPTTVELQDLSEIRVIVLAYNVARDAKADLILRNLPHLTGVYVQRLVRDKELENMTNLPKLRFLELRNTHLSDNGLARLSEFVLLEELRLGGFSRFEFQEAATSAGFDFLPRLARLRMLKLDSDVADGIPQLADLGQLTDLELSGKCVSLKTLKAIENLKNLRRLAVSDESSDLNDAKVATLLKMRQLDKLVIGRFRNCPPRPEIFNRETK